MIDRVKEYSDSDSVRFGELLYAGEFISKLTTSAFICSLEEDRDNHRYRIIHTLVRASGLGDWSKALDDALIGPGSKHLPLAMRDHSRAFTEKVGKGTWQYESVKELNELMKALKKDSPPLTEKISLRSWFQVFSELRNKTRGHGALTPAKSASLCAGLAASVNALASKNPIFSLSWIYLHRNMSGKYTVVDLQNGLAPLADIKSYLIGTDENFRDGV
jgi:hypothetical protein